MNANKKHILIITPGFASSENDFYSLPMVQDYLLYMQENHPEIRFSIITLEYPDRKEVFKWHGISVYPVGKKKYFKRISRIRCVIKIANIIHKNDHIDVIQSLWLGPGALAGNRFSKSSGIPHVCTLMGQDAKASNRYLRWVNLNKMRIIALSDRQKNLFLKNTGRKCDAVIPWGTGKEIVSEELNTVRKYDVLGAGAFSEGKRYEDFIEVICLAKKNFPFIKCLLIGEGPQKNLIEAMIVEKGLKENIDISPTSERKNLFLLMAQSKIFLHPSEYEGQGLTSLEALANGCIVISRPAGFAQSSDRWMVCDDINEMAEGVKNILSSFPEAQSVILQSYEETAAAWLKEYERK